MHLLRITVLEQEFERDEEEFLWQTVLYRAVDSELSLTLRKVIMTTLGEEAERQGLNSDMSSLETLFPGLGLQKGSEYAAPSLKDTRLILYLFEAKHQRDAYTALYAFRSSIIEKPESSSDDAALAIFPMDVAMEPFDLHCVTPSTESYFNQLDYEAIADPKSRLVVLSATAFSFEQILKDLVRPGDPDPANDLANTAALAADSKSRILRLTEILRSAVSQNANNLCSPELLGVVFYRLYLSLTNGNDEERELGKEYRYSEASTVLEVLRLLYTVGVPPILANLVSSFKRRPFTEFEKDFIIQDAAHLADSYLTRGASAVPYTRQDIDKELDPDADHGLWYHVVDAAARAI